MTTPTPTFWLMHVDDHTPLDERRVYLFNLWFHYGLHDRILNVNQDWFRLGAAIVSGGPLNGLDLGLSGVSGEFYAEWDYVINYEASGHHSSLNDDRPFEWLFDDPAFEKFVDGQFE